MSLSSVDVEKWLRMILSEDGLIQELVSTRVYKWPAPIGITAPAITYRYSPGQSWSTLGDSSALVEHRFDIYALGKPEDMIALQDIAERVDVLLKDQKVEYAGWRFTVRRGQGEINSPEIYAGTTRFGHLGAPYRIIVQGTV